MVLKTQQFIALGNSMGNVPEVLTLGVKPNFRDYTPHERDLIHKAECVLFPGVNYAQFLTTIGKKIFPSLETYLYADEKIKQTTLFQMLDIPHPPTRFYYHLHHRDILKDFKFPFIAKLPRYSARGRGVFMIQNQTALDQYLELVNIAYIQEYLGHDRDLRVVLINYEPVLAYWRITEAGNFRSNLFQGGTIDFKDIPPNALALAQKTAHRCRLNNVGLDLIFSRGRWHVIEANMKYGLKGLTMKGLDPKEIIRKKLLAGEI